MRRRNIFLFGGVLAATSLSLYSDPDGGNSTIFGGLAVLQVIWAIAAAHWGRKALTDYPEADQRGLFSKAKESATGAGLALIALAIVFASLLLAFSPRAHADTLPDGFYANVAILKAEQRRFWPEHPDPAALAALVEQESCSSLRSPKCWDPKARLKSAREEGAGLGQVTRAYRADGSLRFDSLADERELYPELREISWDNVYERPDLQLRGLVLMSRDSANSFRGSRGWLHFGDAGYNGSVAGVQRERRACKATDGCNPDVWFGNVELHCLKSRQPLYGGRSACDINREHTRNVFMIRKEKYEDWL